MRNAPTPAKIPAEGQELATRPPSASSSMPDAAALLRAFRRRLVLALGLGTLAAAAGAGAAWLVVPAAKYKADARIRVDSIPPALLFRGQDQQGDPRTFQKTQLELVKSRSVLTKVLQDPAVAALPSVQAAQRSDPLEWLDREVMVDFVPGSDIMRIIMTGSYPKDLEVLVNAVTDNYMTQVAMEEQGRHKDREEKLNAIWKDYQVDLKEKRQKLRDRTVAAGSDDKKTLVLQTQLTMQNLASVENERIAIRSEARRLAAELAALQAAPQPTASPASPAAPSAPTVRMIAEQVERDAGIQAIRNEIQKLTDQHDGIRRLARGGADPSLVAIRRRLEAAGRDLQDRRELVRRGLERSANAQPGDGRLGPTSSGGGAVEQAKARLRILEQLEKDLGQEIGRLRTQIGTQAENTVDLQTDQEQVAVLAETTRRIKSELESMAVEKDAPQRIRVVDRAVAPRTKDEMKQVKASLAGAAGMFGMVVLAVSFWEGRSRRIGTVDEVVRGLGIRLVGALPALPEQPRRRAIGGVSAQEKDWHRLMVESVDAVRMTLLHASRSESIRAVMVASAGAGEGKTSLACHLATSLARSGRRTLLLDCDLRRPAVHRLFEIPQGPGVSDLLRGEADAVNAIRATPAPDLDVIPAGTWDDRSAAALSRGGLQPILDRLKEQYDFIIVDSAPVLAASDSLLIGQHVDAVLFSILRDVSRAPMVRAAEERLASLGVRILGAVIAGADAHDEFYSVRYDYSA